MGARFSLGRMTVALAVLAVAPFALGFGPPGVAGSEPNGVLLTASRVPAVIAMTEPVTTSAAAVVLDQASGRVLYAKNADSRRAPASLTKIMTAIVAVENSSPTDIVEVHTARWDLGDGSVMGLRDGEVLTMRDLLIGLLLPSGNDAALAIAEHIAGSESRFVSLMNAKAQELGLRQTHFANSHGLDDPAHYSSAYDLGQLGRYALSKPLIAEIVSMPSATVVGQKWRYDLQNTNPLFDAMDGVTGVKTGTTDEAGYCLVGSVTRGGRATVFALMDSQDRRGDSKKLVDFVYKHYVAWGLDLPASPFYSVVGITGNLFVLKAAKTVPSVLPVWQGGGGLREIRLDAGLPLTGTAGSPVGKVLFALGDGSAVESELYVVRNTD